MHEEMEREGKLMNAKEAKGKGRQGKEKTEHRRETMHRSEGKQGKMKVVEKYRLQ